MGKIFEANEQRDWMCSHATVPTPLYLGEEKFRIYFSTRDSFLRNQVGFIEIKLREKVEITHISEKPVISLGDLGHFDCDGIYATSIVHSGDDLMFFYAGWNAGLRGLFYSSIGLAVSKDGGSTFERYSKAPILGRDEIDPWAVMAPFVLKISESKWMMWYASGIKLFYDGTDKLRSRYDIKTAISQDGYTWEKTGNTAISLGSRDTNIARACVLLTDSGYEVWYPYVNKFIDQYRIGYGQSVNGLNFTRMDDAPQSKIFPSEDETAWDSKAVTYPHIFEHRDRRYMLFNGNEFGKSGFGLALWEDN